MELANLTPNETIEIELSHPKDGPCGVYVRVFGKDAKKTREIMRAKASRRAELVKGRASMALTPDEIEAEVVGILADAIESWRGLEEGGEPMPCTRDNKLRVLEISWIRRAVEDAFSDDDRFFAEC